MGEHVLVFSLGESIAGGIPFHFVRASNNLVPRGRDSFVQQRDYYSSVTPSAVQKSRPLRGRDWRDKRNTMAARSFFVQVRVCLIPYTVKIIIFKL